MGFHALPVRPRQSTRKGTHYPRPIRKSEFTIQKKATNAQLSAHRTAPFVDAPPLLSMPVSYANGSNMTFGEEQPENFDCNVQYKPRGITLYSIDVLINLVTGLSTLAMHQWTQILDSFTWEDAGLRLRFVSTRAPGRQKLATKEVMWAIRFISNSLHGAKQGYREVNFQPFYKGSELLGSAQLLKIAGPSSNPPSGAASNVAVTKRADMGAEMSGNGSVIQLPDAVTPGASNAGAEIANLAVYSNGKTFDPYIIYTILMNLNILLAQQDNKAMATGGVYGFDILMDWQVGIQALGPTSLSLTPRIIVETTADLAVSLALVLPIEHRWKEAAFKIKDNGRVVGDGFIHHKDRKPNGSSQR